MLKKKMHRQTYLSSGNSSINTTIPIKETSSAISNTYIPETKATDNRNLITQFTEFCNNKDIKSAYNLLTEECKETNFPKIEDFENNYYKAVFTENRMCDMQSWIVNDNKYTYNVKFMKDILSSGKLDDAKGFVDYITIVETESGEQKLNINSYVGRKNIAKEETVHGIKIKVLYKDMYIDYEKYNIEIINRYR